MAIETKIMNCITCPMGCELTVTLEDGKVIDVKGNICPRGKKYAETELTAPMRMLTSTVQVAGGLLPLLPVVSKNVLPKGQVEACAEYLRTVQVEAPIAEGQVVCGNILGLGVDIVASRAMEKL